MVSEEERKAQVAIVNLDEVNTKLDTLLTYITAAPATNADMTTLLARLTAARAGYLDELAAANIPADLDALVSRITAARAGYIDELAAANLPSDIDSLLTRLSSARAGYLDHLDRNRPDLVCPSAASAGSIITLPAVAADVDFPSVTISLIPSGATVKYADYVLVPGKLEDSSGSENQVDQASKSIRAKISTGSWGTDDIQALVFANNSLEAAAGPSVYTPCGPLYGGIDISSIIITNGNGTYNFRSEETERSEGVTVTGASLLIHEPTSIIRIWYN